ncbi:type IV secretory system conjugative DNA transfer family protein [Mycoplasma sp. Pen4]|nr:type IV secretory system conjugative DNA transfer family protein [Mycoplasma sp. Pen4]QNM93851.1 type IV secretory system conjugative DNA transfer family protein [Mycoplasma sp. Pen4]
MATHHKPNLVLTDPKGEILSLSGNILKENGYDIKVLDLMNIKDSILWNPLFPAWEAIHKSPKNLNLTLKEQENENADEEITMKVSEWEIAEAFKEIETLVDAIAIGISDGGSKRDIWERNGKVTVNIILKFMLLYSIQEASFKLENFNLSSVLEFLELQQFKNGAWTKILQQNKEQQYWKSLFDIWKTQASINDDTLTSTLFNATDIIGPFSKNPELVTLTSRNNFVLSELFKESPEKPFALYIRYNDAEASTKFLITIFVTQVYNAAIKFTRTIKNNQLPRSLYFLLEEFNTLANIDIADWMAISRSRKIFFMLILQDFEQLAKYANGRKGDELIKNQAQILYYLHTNSVDSMNTISKLLGKVEVEKVSTTASKNGTSESTSIIEKDLMSVDELKTKDTDEMIVFTAGYKPFLFKPKPFYKMHDLSKLEKYVVERQWNENKDNSIFSFDYSSMLKKKVKKELPTQENKNSPSHYDEEIAKNTSDNRIKLPEVALPKQQDTPPELLAQQNYSYAKVLLRSIDE